MSALQIIDYGAGNLRSVAAALRRLGIAHRVVATAHDFDGAAPVILPGVGAAGSAMAGLTRTGLADALRHTTAPILGICLGMQLLGAASDENAATTLGLVAGRTARLRGALKVPHMGWNAVHQVQPTALFAGIPDGTRFYFAHTYVLRARPEEVIATSEYGATIPVAVQRRALVGVQFHPEKSGDAGMQLLNNFCAEAMRS